VARVEQGRFVSVIIPSKRETLLQHCLSSLEKQTYPTNMFEVIIVSPKPILNEIHSPMLVRIIVDDKANQAEARNIAEKIARGDVLAFCDDDCVLPSGWIENALKHFSDNKVATVGGPSIPPLKYVSFREIISGLLMMSFLGTGSHRKAYISGHEIKQRLCNPVEIICANMFVDRYKFREVGGFDEVVPQEEDRLNTKFLKRNYKLIYDPKCYNIHYQRPWGFRAVRNIFWLMAGQGSLTAERRVPSSVLYLVPPFFAIGLVAGPFFFSLTLLRDLYIIFASIYVVSVIAEALHLLFKNRDQLSKVQQLGVLIILPFVFLVHHIASGFGFLYGFFRRFFNIKVGKWKSR
jgi:glycosyltransferase involved in cell wall biosynthesis